MTTPKSPEEIIAELKLSEERVRAMYGTAVTVGEDWIRSSMASLLLYMAERMGPEPRELLPAEEMQINTFEKGYNTAFRDVRTLLTNEARKITEYEK